MKAYIFPGQGAQFTGMGLPLYENSAEAKSLFEHANDILGFDITSIMFEGSKDDLKETEVTQPAIFLHSVILAKSLGSGFQPDIHLVSFRPWSQMERFVLKMDYNLFLNVRRQCNRLVI